MNREQLMAGFNPDAPKDTAKYGKDAPFADPVVRCDSCGKLLYMESVTKVGSCEYCGSRKVRNAQTLQPFEIAEMKERGIDPAFLALFEEVDS